MIARICIVALLAVGCGAIVGLDDDASEPDARPDAGGSENDDEVDADAGSASADAGQADAPEAATDDPNWAAWPVPPDSPSELVRDGDVVRDPITGLDWHAAVSDEMRYADMAAYCEASTTGGHDDWRLPSWIERMSIVDYAHQSPALNLGLFSGPESGLLLTSTRYSAERIVGSLLYDGSHLPLDPALSGTYTQCVRGAGAGDTAPARRYEIRDEVVLDRSTRLEWQRSASTERMAFSAAEQHCAALTLDGGGWRLPTIKQLLSLFDATSLAATRWYAPAFGSTVMRETWSRTKVENKGYWVVDFGAGGQTDNDPSKPDGVRCVRE